MAEKKKTPPVVHLSYSKGEQIIKEGDYGISIYKIHKGHVRIFKKSNNTIVPLAKLKRGEEAIESIKKLIEIDPHDGNSYDSYGEVLIELGEYEEALEKLEQAERIDPNGWFICHTYQKMGICYEKLGLPNKVKECNEKLSSVEKRRGIFYKDIYEKKSSNQSSS